MSKTAKTSERPATSQRAAAHGNAALQPRHADGPGAAIHGSPRMATQRQRAMVAFGEAAQRVEDEEPLQGKFEAAQRVEEEEPLQGKFETAQRVEEEEPLQGKFDTAQRAEEEELLQGKFEAAQRVENEEPMQGKFETSQRAEDEELLQAKRADAPANKTGMPDQLKSGIESMSGMDLSDVRVHRDSGKAADLQAHAYAQGNDIHVAPGQEKHLPHEAWHVVQQRQGRVKPTMQLQGVAVNDDVGLEREADVMGAKALQRKPDPRHAGETPTQRMPAVAQRDIDVKALAKHVQEQRQEAARLQKIPKLAIYGYDLEMVWQKLSWVSGALAEHANDETQVLEIWDKFIDWTEDHGYNSWEQFTALAKEHEVVEKKNEATARTFSTACEAVFADMNNQFTAWDGTLKNRGAWWGSPGPGDTAGARKVPHDVVQELKARVRGAGWAFRDSRSGGVSFHRTRGSVDFIYHMLPPD